MSLRAFFDAAVGKGTASPESTVTTGEAAARQLRQALDSLEKIRAKQAARGK